MPRLPSRPDVALSAATSSANPRWLALGAIVSAMTMLWLVVLPQVSAIPVVQQRIERYHDLGIDPSAKFYTELDATEGAYRALRQARARAPTAWWQPSSGTGSPQ